ncbi:hypothetical protein C0991_003786 [Blastosporella zonata]|nr:hypothetical protein C0991_003786 [Blastosporella zonata]
MQFTSLFVLASLAVSSLCAAVGEVKRQTSEGIVKKMKLHGESTYLGLAPGNGENDYQLVFVDDSQAGAAEQWLFSGSTPSYSLQNVEYGVYLYVDEQDLYGEDAQVLFSSDASDFLWTVDTSESDDDGEFLSSIHVTDHPEWSLLATVEEDDGAKLSASKEATSYIDFDDVPQE